MPSNSDSYQALDVEQCLALADALGDTPHTVISAHQLRRRLCTAYVVGDPSKFDGVIVQSKNELKGFGSNPVALWNLLKSVKGWDSVEVDTSLAPQLGEIIEKHPDVTKDLFQIVVKRLKSANKLTASLKEYKELTKTDLF